MFSSGIKRDQWHEMGKGVAIKLEGFESKTH